MLQHLLGWLGPSTPWQDCGEKGKAQSLESVVGRETPRLWRLLPL